MILSHGKTEYIDNKKKLIRYHFFSDERFGGRDAISFWIPAFVSVQQRHSSATKGRAAAIEMADMVQGILFERKPAGASRRVPNVP